MHDHAAFLEAEGELTVGLTAEALGAVAEQAGRGGLQVRQIVDLGCGPGVGTVALAKAFPDATVVAVDNFPAMLERAPHRAEELGCGDRVETRQLDLNGDLQSLGSCDLVWAAMSVHHTTSEVATLRAIRGLIAPDGIACILERAAPTTVHSDDPLGRPGIWDRIDDAQQRSYQHTRHHLPGAMNDDAYPALLRDAGLSILSAETLSRRVQVPDTPNMRQFVERLLRGSVVQLASFADADDLRAIEGVISPAASVGVLQDVQVTISRRVFVARSSA